MLFAVFFAFLRFLEIVTLIPTMGILAYFVNGYITNNILTPDFILILFIVSVLALAWAVFTLFSYHRSSTNARFVGFVDLLFVGALIAGVYFLRFIGSADCTNVQPGSDVDLSLGIFGSVHLNGFQVAVDKSCALLKACFAFGIINILLFAATAFLAILHGNSAVVEERHYKTRTTTHHHRHHSRGSHHGSRRSSHSHHRAYV